MEPDAGCAVYIEGHEVARATELTEAILLLGVAMFVFHQKPSTVKNLMWVLCRYVFKISPETRPNAQTKTVMQDLIGGST